LRLKERLAILDSVGPEGAGVVCDRPDERQASQEIVEMPVVVCINRRKVAAVCPKVRNQARSDQHRRRHCVLVIGVLRPKFIRQGEIDQLHVAITEREGHQWHITRVGPHTMVSFGDIDAASVEGPTRVA
jgi:hypothetical protein